MKVSQTSEQQILEVTENLIASAKRLENDFQRLDKTSSVVDLRVELEELERFAVINRFAKFHVRGQTDTSGSSSFGTTKRIPQRYVTAFPMPRHLPEGVQCLSL
uniref:Uncharacterized protein n=1 Tax=Rhizophora mucronata TaxID=61149 RepID=A0A2P2JAM9_RHIMU